MRKALCICLIFLLFSTVTVMAALYGERLCDNPDFVCVKIKKHDSWNKLFPDPQQQNLVRRINRMNTELEPGMIIAIPKNYTTAEPMEFSPFPQSIESPGEKLVLVNLNQNAWAAYDNAGQLVRWGPASGGQDWCPDISRPCHTPHGTFSVYAHGSEDCKSTKFPVGKGGAPMPYCMYFHGGFALHGSYEVPGYNASHGCVRMFVDDAEWLNTSFTDLPDESNQWHGTKVIILPYHSDEED